MSNICALGSVLFWLILSVIARSVSDEAISRLTYAEIASPSAILPHQKVETFLELSVSNLERRQ
jgi:hypothetical protein